MIIIVIVIGAFCLVRVVKWDTVVFDIKTSISLGLQNMLRVSDVALRGFAFGALQTTMIIIVIVIVISTIIVISTTSSSFNFRTLYSYCYYFIMHPRSR